MANEIKKTEIAYVLYNSNKSCYLSKYLNGFTTNSILETNYFYSYHLAYFYLHTKLLNTNYSIKEVSLTIIL